MPVSSSSSSSSQWSFRKARTMGTLPFGRMAWSVEHTWPKAELYGCAPATAPPPPPLPLPAGAHAQESAKCNFNELDINGNAVPMPSGRFLTMGTAFQRVPLETTTGRLVDSCDELITDMRCLPVVVVVRQGSRQSEVSHLEYVTLTDKHIACCYVTMDALKEQNHIRPTFAAIILFRTGGVAMVTWPP